MVLRLGKTNDGNQTELGKICCLPKDSKGHGGVDDVGKVYGIGEKT